MRGVELGRSGVVVSPVVLGTMCVGGSAEKPAERTHVEIIRAALDAGVTAIDTAPIYGFGDAERAVGLAVRGRDATVITKVGLGWEDPRGQVLFAHESRLVRKQGRPELVRACLEGSLARLGLDAVDAAQLHFPDPEVPLDDSIGALLRLRDEGKVRAIGVSHVAAKDLERLDGVDFVQLDYNLLRLGPERELIPAARRRGIAVLACSPFCEGVLSGAFPPARVLAPDDERTTSFVFDDEVRAVVHDALEETVKPIARRRGATVAQVVIAWLLAQPSLSAVVAGAGAPFHAVEDARAAEFALAPAEVAAIRERFAPLGVDLKDPHLGARAKIEILVHRVLSRSPFMRLTSRGASTPAAKSEST